AVLQSAPQLLMLAQVPLSSCQQPPSTSSPRHHPELELSQSAVFHPVSANLQALLQRIAESTLVSTPTGCRPDAQRPSLTTISLSPAERPPSSPIKQVRNLWLRSQ